MEDSKVSLKKMKKKENTGTDLGTSYSINTFSNAKSLDVSHGKINRSEGCVLNISLEEKSKMFIKSLEKEFLSIKKSDFIKIIKKYQKFTEFDLKTVVYNVCFIKNYLNKGLDLDSPCVSATSFDFLGQESDFNRTVLSIYKVNPCKDSNCTNAECMHYHQLSEKRRQVKILVDGSFNYYPSMGSAMKCAVNEIEKRYHFFTYKSKPCSKHNGMDKDKFCPKAHSMKEIRNIPKLVEMLKKELLPYYTILKTKITEKNCLATFKTARCPNRDCPNSYTCQYYHNDFERRRINSAALKPIMCPLIFVENKYLHPSKCPRNDSCPFCHTKNELYFHPVNYHKKPCIRRHCPYGPKFCPDLHTGPTSPPPLSPVKQQISASAYFQEKIETSWKELAKLQGKIQKFEIMNKLAAAWKCDECSSLIKKRIYVTQQTESIPSKKYCLKCGKHKSGVTLLRLKHTS